MRERIFINARYAVGDGDGGQACATRERRTTDAGYAVGDGGIHASSYQRIACCFYYSVTIVTRVIVRITCFHNNGSQASAISERSVTDAGDAIGDGDRSQARAAIERVATDACHAIWNGNGSQA